jgi:steroid delta-isomerase-like uncharacterized protein
MADDEIRNLMTRFYDEVMSKGNLDAIDELVSPDYIEHDDDSLAPGREGLKQHVSMIRRGFPDMTVKIEDMVIDGNRGAARTSIQATHSGEFMGMPPTGKRVEITGMDFVRFDGGLSAEHWGMTDSLAMMKQLGLLGGPGR